MATGMATAGQAGPAVGLLPPYDLRKRTAFNISKNETYIFSICQPDTPNPAKFAASASNHVIKIYSREKLTVEQNLKGHAMAITGLRFSPTDPNLVYSCGADSTVVVWDLRTASPATHFAVPDDMTPTALDANADDSILAIGTELLDEDARLLLYDCRAQSFLCSIDDAHSDDITQVKFNPANPGVLATGSTDGLVNVYDLSDLRSLQSPDDALVHTLNSESSVSKIGFFGPSHEYIYGVTHIETLLLWHAYEREREEDDLIANFGELRENLNASGVALDYLIDCKYNEVSQRLFLFGGTHDGGIDIYHVNMDSVDPCLSLRGAHSQTVRAVHWDCQGSNTIVSGAEDAGIALWAPRQALPPAADTSTGATRKSSKDGRDSKRSNPY